ncbi:MAG: 23S rRNA (pseudouridine(1915)-N(3))-methyltransferase RlmH [Lachnospiraceae bacterium]|nr:23S rRNA (pseudouridine(1915)-N(3))-methyltransferase RlmH [Lachnospiraceae bacterium]
MQKITVAAAGKIKEKYFTQAVEEYSKRLSRYCRLEIAEVTDEKTPDDAGQREEEMIREKEGARLLKVIPDSAFCVVLAIDGSRMSSVELAEWIGKKASEGVSHICFVIGGSLGLSPAVMKRADLSLSFSDMTFPHQLMRVILLEQIYRSFRIINHEPYHK